MFGRDNPFLLILLPMWGMILAISVARVVDSKKEDKEREKVVDDKILYQKPKKSRKI